MRDRRELLTLLGVGITGLAGCGSRESGTPVEGNSTGTPTGTPEEGSGEDFIRPEEGLAEEAYNEVVDTFSGRISVDPSGDTVREKVRDAAFQGAQQGRTHYENQNDLVNSESAYTAMAAANTVEDFNYEDGDAAIPHLVYNAGQVPANILQFQDGESDLLTCDGQNTRQEDDLFRDWTEQGQRNDVYWDDGNAWTHILDASIHESGFENAGGPSEYSETAQQTAKDLFSSIAYNNDPHQDNLMDVGITIGSWDAWFAAEEKIINGDAKDIYDDITALANSEEIDNFAFGYDEETDEFVATETYSDSEYSEMNAFEELEWSEETGAPAATSAG